MFFFFFLIVSDSLIFILWLVHFFLLTYAFSRKECDLNLTIVCVPLSLSGPVRWHFSIWFTTSSGSSFISCWASAFSAFWVTCDIVSFGVVWRLSITTHWRHWYCCRSSASFVSMSLTFFVMTSSLWSLYTVFSRLAILAVSFATISSWDFMVVWVANVRVFCLDAGDFFPIFKVTFA